MKKVIAILLVLCVAVTLFAAGSVKVGGSFNFITGGTRDLEASLYDADGNKVIPTFALDKGATYKTNGFGFDVACDFDVAKDLVVWADFNMVFGADAKSKIEGSVEESLDDLYKLYKDGVGDKAYKKINVITFGSGVAYKLTLDPVDVKLGGGLFLNRGFGKVGYKNGDIEEYEMFKSINFGLSLYADASYKINKNFGVGLTLMPQIGLFNSTTMTQYDSEGGLDEIPTAVKGEIIAKGLKLSFAMPIVVGVSYSF